MRNPWVGVDDNSPVHELASPVIPEPSRGGEGDLPECGACSFATVQDELDVYRDELWRVRAIEHTPFPGSAMLMPLRHADGVAGLDAGELASFGPMVAKVSQALMDRPAGSAGFGDGRVGRVHGHLWNDGGAHLHMWLLPRPLGYQDLLGSYLVNWMAVLPDAEPSQVLAAADDLRSRLRG